MGSTRLTFLLALGATVLSAEADPEARKPKAEAAATVTVTAEATPVEVLKTPNPVKIVTEAEIQKLGARNLGELLQFLLPGQILTNGGVGTSTSMLLGGSRSQDVVVMLDGIPLTDASGLGSVNPSAVGLAGIERIEVQSGPCSTRFGSEALGGVIALYTGSSAPKGYSGQLRGALGTRGVQRGLINQAYGFQGGWVRLGLSGEKADQATETDNPYRNVGTHLGVGLELGPDALWTVTYRNTYTGVPIPWQSVSLSTRAYRADRETRTRQEQIIQNLHVVFGTQWELDLSGGVALQSRQEPDDFAKTLKPYTSRRNQVGGSFGWTGANAGLSAAFNAYEEFAATPAWPSGTERGEGRHTAGSLEGHWEPLDSLRLVGGVRQQWDHQSYINAQGKPFPDVDGKSSTWKLGLNWLLPSGFRAYASAGTGFGLPLLSAVMYNRANFGPELGREKSSFQQLGLNWEQGPWNARLELARTRYDELVYFDLNSFSYQNGQNLRLQSAEVAGGWKRNDLIFEAFYRNQEARDLGVAADKQLSSPAVVRRPFQTFGLRSSARKGDFRGDLGWSWSGARYENYGGFPAVIGASKTHFNDLNAGLTWTWQAGLELSLRGTHLLQDAISVDAWKAKQLDGKNDATQIFGFPAQPRTLSLELSYRF